ncbi:TRAP transporter large permease [Paenibacillus albiflavus]|uniref:TRAP transporter large permease n=1 Tax=Paenibacillus albiflavus TaxID=2545760 RepID=A0A4R4DZC3_9BACL|nr:TRAP transporter large permease [Paenibacillus albiflavus]
MDFCEEGGSSLLILIISFMILCMLGVPIAFVLGLVTLIYVLTTGNFNSFETLPTMMFNEMQNFGFVAIPLFVLLGEIMNRGGITSRLIHFAYVIFGGLRGGLAYVNLSANMFLASIVVTANAQTAIVSRIIVPEMQKQGYSKEFSAVLTTSSFIIGPLIPPSLSLLIFGVIAGVSVSQLFLAGILPGVIFAIGFGILIYLYAKKKNLPRTNRTPLRDAVHSLFSILPALVVPLLVIVGITSGALRVTESAAVAVLLASLIGRFFYKEIRVKDIPDILIRTVISTSVVSFMFATANMFNWALQMNNIPKKVTDFFLSIADNTFVFLLLLNVLLLITGIFLKGIGGIIVLTPILTPIAVQYGVDPVHLGIIIVINLTMSLMFPPVGSVLFIASRRTGLSIERLTFKLIPFLILSFGILLIITYLPWVTAFLPNVLGLK